MPSPFPGMDPYLEDPTIFPDLHDRFATFLSTRLNAALPQRYYARLEMRVAVGIGGGREGVRVPHVGIARTSSHTNSEAGGGVGLLEPRVATQPVRIKLPDELLRHYFVEIRDSRRRHDLVTLLEIVSPFNKRTEPDRMAYLRKQREILDSEVNLVEIDLVSQGMAIVATPTALDLLRDAGRQGRYLVAVNRGWNALPRQEYDLYPFGLAEPLPCIPVPLTRQEEEPLLDLQQVLDDAYAGGPYARGLVNYSQLPDVPLTDEESAWVRQRVAKHLGTPAGSVRSA